MFVLIHLVGDGEWKWDTDTNHTLLLRLLTLDHQDKEGAIMAVIVC